MIKIEHLILFFAALLTCGLAQQPRKSSHHTTIVGGEPAVQGQIPYILSLQINGTHHCGASIIEVQGVMLAISAAHCTVWLTEKDEVTVVAGELKLSESSGLEQTRHVTRIINHDFNFGNMKNDICLLFLEEPFQLNNYTKTIELPSKENTNTSGLLQVSGWGLLNEQGNQSDDLMTVQVPIVDDETCGAAYSKGGYEIFDDFLCAGILEEGGIDACQQDSGGPGVSDDGKLIGIVSFGIGCARAEYPGVYTEVSYFLAWINEQVNVYSKH